MAGMASVRVERSIGRIMKESSDLRHRLWFHSIAVVVAAGICAAFSIVAHEVGISLNFDAAVRADCRSIADGPCLYHDFAPTKTDQPPPPGGSQGYNRTLVPFVLLLGPVQTGSTVNLSALRVNDTQLSWQPRFSSATFPFAAGLPTVNGLRAIASVAAVVAAAFQLALGRALLDLETLSGACAQGAREAAAAAALAAAATPGASISGANLVVDGAAVTGSASLGARLWRSGRRVQVSTGGCRRKRLLLASPPLPP